MALKIKLQGSNPKYLNKIIGLQGNEDCLYLKITQQSGNVEHCSITISCFACNESQLPKSEYSQQVGMCINNTSYQFKPNLLGDNFIKQGYEYLKTLPEFEGCVDC